jgi:hypothetical protein
MKTVQLTEAEIDALKAAAAQRIVLLSKASAYAETVAESSNLQMLGVILESAIEALGRAE